MKESEIDEHQEMRLRNKKTGKIWHMPRLRQPTVQEDDISFFACIGEHGCSRGELFSYKSLAELNEDWEDYKPAEPLIKDEKIRKAVRAWAEATGTTIISYWGGELESEQNNSKIEFDGIAVVDFGDNYTIAELCGDEEE
jgi:hypothetical protein